MRRAVELATGVAFAAAVTLWLLEWLLDRIIRMMVAPD